MASQGETLCLEMLGCGSSEELGIGRDDNRRFVQMILQFNCRCQMNGVKGTQGVSFEKRPRASKNTFVQVDSDVSGPFPHKTANNVIVL